MTESAGKPSGLATLDSSGQLAQMPTAADVGASYNSATIVLADTSQSYDLNDYWTPGQLVYVSQGVVDNESVANCPSTTGGLLEVIGSSQNLIIQQYTAVGDGLLYTRHKAITSGNISGWGGVNGIRTETNSNGTYVKYPDGTLIQWGAVPVSFAASEAKYPSWTLPVQFVGLYYGLATVLYGSNQVYIQCQITSRGTETMGLAAKNPGTGQINANVCVLAIGRWK